MLNKNFILFILVFVFLGLFFVGNVNAHFVCGKVFDSAGNMSAAWFSVRAFYPENSEQYSLCDVSPEENKYCCDSAAIPPVGSWEVGNIVGTEIVDFEKGYVASPVYKETSGEGYDIMPDMKLEKVIKLNNPNFKLIFSNENFVFFNASFLPPYNNITFDRGNNSILLCQNCSSYSENIESNFGMNNWRILASFGQRIFSEEIVFAVLNWFKFDRNLICKNCNKNKVRASSNVRIELDLDLSHEIGDMELREYVPVEWEIINSSGEIRSYSDSHNIIVWNISGKDVVKEYYVRAPFVFFFPKKYVFRTELENEVLNEEQIVVYRWFSFFASRKEMYPLEKFNFLKSNIAPLQPLVIYNNSFVDTLAVFPKRKIQNVEFILEPTEFQDSLEAYSFKTNLRKQDISKFYLEFKISKSFLAEYENIEFLVLDDVWRKFNLKYYREDSSYFYYKVYLEDIDGIGISGKKKKFLGIF